MKENIIVGLTSGLVVSLFILVFRHFWNAVIIPWFEERVYKDAKIEGKWYSIYTEKSMKNRKEVISLKRHGHFIKGNIVCVSGPDEGEEYNISGSFRNMILPMVYENTDSSNTDRGTITLKSNGSGKKFSGKVSYYSGPSDNIEDSNVIWFRSQIDLEKTLEELNTNPIQLDDIIDSLSIENIDQNETSNKSLEEEQVTHEIPNPKESKK